jgi:hypothetical protein
MSAITLIAPPNITSGFADSIGNKVQIDATGRVTVDPAVVVLSDFLVAGFTQAPDVAGSTRPTVTYPGMPYFDTNIGKPIWRRSDNGGWVDATGTAV